VCDSGSVVAKSGDGVPHLRRCEFGGMANGVEMRRLEGQLCGCGESVAVYSV
jgi:hypothetical protein